jgi:hypothetical protein
MPPYSMSREIADRRAAQEKYFSEVKARRLGDYFRAQTRQIAAKLQTRASVFIGDRLQYEPDALAFLLQQRAATDTLVLFTHSAVWFPIKRVFQAFGLSRFPPFSNWANPKDVRALVTLSGWTMVHEDCKILCPFRLLGVGNLVNRWIAPLVPAFCMARFYVCRNIPRASEASVSIIVPCRNEAGHIDQIIPRTPAFSSIEWIFVEGGSADDTWERIQVLPRQYPDLKIRAVRQTGTGKGDAVREGLRLATHEMVFVLDSDLSTPPEELPLFYDAMIGGKCEFANGNRLYYPMQAKAMHFTNQVANWFFGLAFSWLLGTPVKDTLCGTKVMWRKDFEAAVALRPYLDSIDPFGDFDMLFGARLLHLRILDIPVHYCDRQYGTTNIQRWRHGSMLFRMLWLAARKIKFI